MELVLDVDHLPGIQLELDQARTKLLEASLDQRRKDTPAARVRLAECIAYVDLLLDQWNDPAPDRL
jgi:hypothetical protein